MTDKQMLELAELLEEALCALRVADKFCGQLTSDECSDSVHIPIQDAIKKVMKYQCSILDKYDTTN